MSGPSPADAWQAPVAAAMDAVTPQLEALTRATQRRGALSTASIMALESARDQLHAILPALPLPMAGAALQPGLRCLSLPAMFDR